MRGQRFSSPEDAVEAIKNHALEVSKIILIPQNFILEDGLVQNLLYVCETVIKTD